MSDDELSDEMSVDEYVPDSQGEEPDDAVAHDEYVPDSQGEAAQELEDAADDAADAAHCTVVPDSQGEEEPDDAAAHDEYVPDSQGEEEPDDAAHDEYVPDSQGEAAPEPGDAAGAPTTEQTGKFVARRSGKEMTKGQQSGNKRQPCKVEGANKTIRLSLAAFVALCATATAGTETLDEANLTTIATSAFAVATSMTLASQAFADGLQNVRDWSPATWTDFKLAARKDAFFRALLHAPIVNGQQLGKDGKLGKSKYANLIATAFPNLEPLDRSIVDGGQLGQDVFSIPAGQYLTAFRQNLSRNTFKVAKALMEKQVDAVHRPLKARLHGSNFDDDKYKAFKRRKAVRLLDAVLGARGSVFTIYTASEEDLTSIRKFYLSTGLSLPKWSMPSFFDDHTRSAALQWTTVVKGKLQGGINGAKDIPRPPVALDGRLNDLRLVLAGKFPWSSKSAVAGNALEQALRIFAAARGLARCRPAGVNFGARARLVPFTGRGIRFCLERPDIGNDTMLEQVVPLGSKVTREKVLVLSDRVHKSGKQELMGKLNLLSKVAGLRTVGVKYKTAPAKSTSSTSTSNAPTVTHVYLGVKRGEFFD